MVPKSQGGWKTVVYNMGNWHSDGSTSGIILCPLHGSTGSVLGVELSQHWSVPRRLVFLVLLQSLWMRLLAGLVGVSKPQSPASNLHLVPANVLCVSRRVWSCLKHRARVCPESKEDCELDTPLASFTGASVRALQALVHSLWGCVFKDISWAT